RSDPGRSLPGEISPPGRPPDLGVLARRARGDDALPLARQRPRAAQRGRTRDRPWRAGSDPRPGSAASGTGRRRAATHAEFAADAAARLVDLGGRAARATA